MIADDQSGRPGTEPFIGDDKLVEKAVIARVARLEAATNSRRIPAGFAEMDDIDTVDDQITEAVKPSILLIEVVVAVAAGSVILEDLVAPQLTEVP